MSVQRYGVLTGHVVDRHIGVPEPGRFEIRVKGGRSDYRVSVNIRSRVEVDGPHPFDLLYYIDSHFEHPIQDQLVDMPQGFTRLFGASSEPCLDYIRGNLFDPALMKPAPAFAPGPHNDLADFLNHYVQRAIHDSTAILYAFGSHWGPLPGRKDAFFHFVPERGVHDVHMNQGNDPRHVADDGVWQDGGLIFHFRGADQWVGIFLAFQSQIWQTDGLTGHALLPPEPEPHLARPQRICPESDIRIIAALVNPSGADTQRVTLLNPCAEDVNLSEWRLQDSHGNQQRLAGLIRGGGTASFEMESHMRLGTTGGTITLLSPAGIKAHGISYTRHQAHRQGRTLVF